MASTIEDLTVTYVEDGVETVKELDKMVLSKGAWTTIIFKLQNWDNKLNDYGPVRYAIRRYQKRSGEYQLKSRFNISSEEQARKIVDVLSGWLKSS